MLLTKGNCTLVDKLNNWLEDIKYLDWNFEIIEGEEVFLQVNFNKNCACREERMMKHYCRKWRISPNITKSEFVQTAFAAIMAAVEHEAREDFKYKNAAVFSPHFDVDKLVELYDNKSWDMRVNSFDVDDYPRS